MCGIAGIYAYREDSPAVDADELLRVRDQMIKRGPDGAGLWVDATRRIGLAHRRLAIIDLSEAGAQPMSTPDGRFTVTFNGEIYNYRELRADLEKDGVVLRSHSDTEVLLHLYRRHGPDMLAKLRGMYAFGLWDAAERSLFLARDPFGIKPLYYADDGKTFRFASQVKALIAGGQIPRTIEPAAQVGFFVWGAVPEPFTIYKGVLALPAGTWLQVKQGQASTPTRHYCIAEAFARAEAAPRGKATREDHLQTVLESLQSSVRAHMIADVPVGLFLSAGIDSNLVARYAREATREPIQAVTLAFAEYTGTAADEAPVASRAARAFSLDHTVRHVNKTDFRSELEALFAAMDQPTVDGVNSYFVSKITSEAGIKVALSGLGGDELLAGYPSFTQVPALVRRVSAIPAPLRAAGPLLRRLVSPLLPARRVSPKYAGSLEYGATWFGAYLLRRALHMPWEVPGVLSKAETCSAWETLVETQQHELAKLDRIEHRQLKVSYLELSFYLRNQLVRDADWAGMSHSLEVRVPFLDVPFLECVAAAVSAVPDVTKRPVASASVAGIPAAVLDRPKTGFAVPVRDWLMDSGHKQRGLRGWSKRIAAHWEFPSLRILALVTDAFGGIGGIAKFNRDLLTALADDSRCHSIEAFPRLVQTEPKDVPTKVAFRIDAAGRKSAYVRALLSVMLPWTRVNWVICGHINLVPLAWLAGALKRSPVTLIVHGIDAWTPHRSRLVKLLLKRLELIVAVSEFTVEKMSSWTGIPRDRFEVLPNCVDLEKYSPRPRDVALVDRYQLGNKTVLMTVSRLVSTERYKGIDEVMDAMPSLLHRYPDLHYLIVGDGDDRPRLGQKARELNLGARITFTGHVKEEEKSDHYSLADAFVMPSRGEGFGIVFLEALASGVPVLGSKMDGSRDALLGGRLGTLVDPSNAKDVADGIATVLSQPRGIVPAELGDYSLGSFKARVQTRLIRTFVERKSPQ